MIFRQSSWSGLLAGLLLLSPLSAAVRFQVDTLVEREDETKKTVENITIDGDRARIDYQMLDGDRITNGLHVITLDGGESLALISDKESACSNWGMADFSREIGRYVTDAEKMVNAKVAIEKVEKTLEEPGPEILGQPTLHIRMVSSFGGKAKILVKKFKYAITVTDDIWLAPGIEMDFLERQWWSSLAETGYGKIDEMSEIWNAEVLDRGAILKRISTVRLLNRKSNKEQVKTETVKISAYEEIDAATLPADVFSVPDCQQVSKKAMKKKASKMIRHHVK